VCWGDTRNGQNNADIWIASSMDGGKTWNEPVRVNDDETTTASIFTLAKC
jgi:Neuraminidase (sialidase)